MSIIQGSAHTSAGGGGYQIERSLRFNSADSAYLNRTLSSSGNMKVFTLSFWLKRTALGVINNLFTVRNAIGSGAEYFQIKYNANDTISVIGRDSGSVVRCNISSTAVFRDPGAWAHIVISFNASSTTLNVYANNVVIANSTSIGNVNYGWNNSSLTYHRIGDGALLGEANLNGYMAELYHVDGQALTPSSFGETDSATGVWKPKAYSGTYGTNGFFLKFADNSGTTSTTLGKDSSGNGNNWTPNNFSVTAGSGNDSMVDSPTSYGTDTGAGGEVRGNYATLNPLTNTWSAVLTNGNLNYSFTGSSTSKSVAATIAIPTTGSWYWEAALTADENENLGIGIIKTSFAPYSYSCVGTTSNAGTGNSYGRSRSSTWNGTTNTAASVWNNTSDVIQFAYDATNGKLWFGKNNTWQSGDPATGTSPSYSSISGEFYPVVSHDSGVSRSTGCIFNFGQRAFAYTAPSGFKALCTQNLPTPTIGATSTTQAGDYFNPVLYTGTGATRSVTGVGFQPSFIWFKRRDTSGNNVLVDAVRGVNSTLFSDLTAAQDDDTSYGLFTSFDSDGFTLGNGSAQNYGSTNTNGSTYVAWNWNAGGSNATNTSGTITSTVRANTTSGFSIVTYTGNGSAGARVGHGLGVAPSMIIVKQRGGTTNWAVYHASLPSAFNVAGTQVIYLNATTANTQDFNVWDSNNPLSTYFSIGASTLSNANTGTYVAYCFAAVAGYSAFGSYTGNGSADGPFCYTGFRPSFVMLKRSDSADEWAMHDYARPGYNATNLRLIANSSGAELSTQSIDLTSNGFKIRSTSSSHNASGGTYIYMAVAENPFKYSLAR